MGKNVAVFVDVANIFYAAKAAGVDIDYVTLLKAGSAGRDLVRAYAYTGLDPENENQRNFHDFLRRIGYKVVSKDIRKYGDGKVKANLDIELVVDMMKTARNLDVAIVVSGDGDFAPAIRAVQEMGVRVEVVSFRGNTSSDLMDVADQFTDIVQIAKVEKGSSRSGRRVAGDEQDLSMTEVPDKQSEGSGERTRGRGRTRRTATPLAASSSGRGRSRPADADGDVPVVVLPGEKLSRAAASTAPIVVDDDIDEVEELEGEDAAEAGAATNGTGEFGEEGPRRRRRRGGRGRGRSRGREEGAFADAPASAAAREPGSLDEAEGEDEDVPPQRRSASVSAFGSVWDSQIGIPSSGRRSTPAVDDEEDFDEPSVPEYLITERRQRDGGRGGRGRGGRGGAYAAALDRERFGGGRGTPSRYQEPQRGGGGFGRDRGGRGPRDERPPFRQPDRPAPRPSGDEPWSEVPPEIEAMLRAQMGSRPAPAARPQPVVETSLEPAATATEAAPARRGRRPSAKAAGAGDVVETAAPAATAASEPAPKARRTTRAKPTAAEAPAEEAPAKATRARAAGTSTAGTTARRTSTRSKAAAAEAAPAEADAAPKKRTTRKKADAAG